MVLSSPEVNRGIFLIVSSDFRYREPIQIQTHDAIVFLYIANYLLSNCYQLFSI